LPWGIQSPPPFDVEPKVFGSSVTPWSDKQSAPDFMDNGRRFSVISQPKHGFQGRFAPKPDAAVQYGQVYYHRRAGECGECCVCGPLRSVGGFSSGFGGYECREIGSSLLSYRLPHFFGLISGPLREFVGFSPQQESRKSKPEREYNKEIIAGLYIAPKAPPPVFFLLGRLIAGFGSLYFVYVAIDSWAERKMRDARIAIIFAVGFGLLAVYGYAIGSRIAMLFGYGAP
jgi:hypothetical protein